MNDCGMSVRWLCYALATFTDEDAFNAYHQAIGETCDYHAMRQEVAERFFGGKVSFDTTDTLDADASGGTADFSSDSPSD